MCCISCICTQQVSCPMLFCRTTHCATGKFILLSHTSSHITLLLYDPLVYFVYFSSSHRSVCNPSLPPSLFFIPKSLLCFFLWILRRCPTSLLLLNIQSSVGIIPTEIIDFPLLCVRLLDCSVNNGWLHHQGLLDPGA